MIPPSCRRSSGAFSASERLIPRLSPRKSWCSPASIEPLGCLSHSVTEQRPKNVKRCWQKLWRETPSFSKDCCSFASGLFPFVPCASELLCNKFFASRPQLLRSYRIQRAGIQVAPILWRFEMIREGSIELARYTHNPDEV